MSHGTKIRRRLRSARVSALTAEERHEAMLAPELANELRGDRQPPEAGAGRGPSPQPRADVF